MSTELVVSCGCGFEARGEPDELVAIMQQHGREVHNMDATVEQVLALARPTGRVADPTAEV
jgi:hypothetical protein